MESEWSDADQIAKHSNIVDHTRVHEVGPWTETEMSDDHVREWWILPLDSLMLRGREIEEQQRSITQGIEIDTNTTTDSLSR